MNQYLDIFIEESKEHLQSCNEKLLELEKNPADLSIVNDIFRSAHTLKGMSATMGYEDLANLTHQMENVLDAIRNKKLTVTPVLFDAVFASLDHLEEMVLSIANGGSGKKDVRAVIKLLQQIENGTNIQLNGHHSENSSTFEQTIQYDDYESSILSQSLEQGFSAYELTITLLEDCLLKSARVYMVFNVLEEYGEVIKTHPTVQHLEEEKFDNSFHVMLITKKSGKAIKAALEKVSEVANVHVQEINLNQLNLHKHQPDKFSAKEELMNKIVQTSKPVTSTKTIRVNIERLDMLMNLFEELVIDRGRLEQISKQLNNDELSETVERMARISSDLQSIILNMRMVPVETVFNRFPRMIRQLSKELNKKIRIEIAGADTELDRTVVEEIGDPLVHLIRNAIDHGIERPNIRLQNGKSEEGNVFLRAYHSGNHVYIEIEDDGAGINRDRVLKKAVANGMISEENAEKLTDNQVYELIFTSGFTTADEISDVSGRGVGLDVVRNTIEALGGFVTIDSKKGQGTLFVIQLPLTLSIISVMLVQLQNETYAIPISSIIETAVAQQDEILETHNRKVIDYRGKIIPFINLSELFEVPQVASKECNLISYIIVGKGEKMAALAVDSFIGQQEVVLKPLGNYLKNIFAISGATILGNGEVALIIDCNSILR